LATSTAKGSVARGRGAEEAAAEYLRQHGWVVLERNLRTPVGELDLVCLDGGEAVVVEVKARASNLFGDPLESIGPRKERRLRAAAAWWMASRGEIGRGMRFDVVTVALDSSGSVCSLTHLRDVLGCGR
jgi:putative endonuclease